MVIPSHNEPSRAGTAARAAFEALPRTGLRAALVGSGIQDSRTPSMHEAEGARLHLGYSYSLIDFDALGLPHAAIGDVLELAAEYRLAGLNVTHPFKQSIIPHLDELTPETADIGAVNTVVFDGGRAVGHNTDCWGFAESFRMELLGVNLSRVLLIGAGGAGSAVARALLDLGAREICIFDLDHGRAAELAAKLDAPFATARALPVRDGSTSAQQATGLVNTTPVGMTKYPGTPIPTDLLRPGLWVADIVYFPAETALLRAAAAVGCRVLSGRGMAVFQAVKAFELITGHRPDAQKMFGHFDALEIAAAKRSD